MAARGGEAAEEATDLEKAVAEGRMITVEDSQGALPLAGLTRHLHRSCDTQHRWFQLFHAGPLGLQCGRVCGQLFTAFDAMTAQATQAKLHMRSRAAFAGLAGIGFWYYAAVMFDSKLLSNKKVPKWLSELDDLGFVDSDTYRQFIDTAVAKGSLDEAFSLLGELQEPSKTQEL
eukprot:g11121.t1